MKKEYISPIAEKIDIPYEESILTGSQTTVGQEFGNGNGGYSGGMSSDEDDIITLSKGNNLFLTYDEEW